VNSRLAILLERLVYQRGGTQAVIAVSKATRAELETRFGLDPARISVIYNGVDLDTFHPNRRGEWRDAIRGQVGIAEGVCLALFVGAFERKGLRYVLEALHLLHDTPVHLLVLGSGQGPGLIQAVRRLGVTDRVSFLGRQAEVQRYFAAADVFVLPTLYEPFGMSVLEAMACGLPVITSRTAGVAELIEDKVDGFLLDDPTDPVAIAQRVGEVLREPQRAAEMGRLARRRAEPYSWDYVVRETEAVYRRALNEWGASA
jgi:UDP-glucose:(heptosyl)LPS alpha-1,3-glucosyltransferase